MGPPDAVATPLRSLRRPHFSSGVLTPPLESFLDAATTVAVLVTLWATGIGLGSSVRLSGIVAALAHHRLIARIIVLDLLLVPLVMWVCVRLLVPADGLATGLLLVAFAAAGPLGIKLAQVARGDMALAIGLVVVLEVANLLAIPVWSSILGVTSSWAVVVDIVRTLVLLVLAPLAVGVLIGRRSPAAAGRLAPAMARIGSAGLVFIIAMVVVRNLDAFDDSKVGAAIAALVVIGFALAAGWVAGGPDRPRRVSASLVTGVRANAAALAVATTSFAHIPEVAVGVVIGGLVSIVLPTVVAPVLGLRDDVRRGGQPASPSVRTPD